ncbi:MAG TPA: glutamine amidotransferase [Armatimonadota bacterium]|jgi:uncharacterized membrane protein
MRRGVWWVGLALLLLPRAAGAGEVGTKTVGGMNFIQLKSPLLEALVAPERGGQIVSLVQTKTGLQFGNTGSLVNGLFSDHDLKQPHPGELMGAVYTAGAPEVGPDGAATVSLSRLAAGGWRDEVAPGLKGLRYDKTYELAPDAPVLRMRMRVTNESGDDKLLDYWLQSIAHVGPGEDRNYYFRPSRTGLSVISSDDVSGRHEFVRDFTAGWMAALDRKAKTGLVYLADYNYLDRLYNCASAYSEEFMYDRVPLPAGKSWETAVQVRVVDGFDSVSYASERLVADSQVVVGPDALQVTHRLCAWAKPLTGVRMETVLVDGASQTRKAAAPVVVPTLGLDTTSFTVDFDSTEGGLKLLVVTVTSDQGVDTYQVPLYPYGDTAGVYRAVAPAKQVTLPKPDDLAAVWRQAKAKPAGLLQVGDFGFAGEWKLAALAKDLGLAYTVAAYTPQASWRAASLFPMPISDAELFRYDVVVLADADALALRRYGCEMLRDYVMQGGGLLVLGGLNSLGKGGMESTPLEELLPVATKGAWDMRPAAGRPVATLRPVTADVTLEPRTAAAVDGPPRVDWFQDTSLRSGAAASLVIDDRPLLATWTRGQGRVAVFTGTTLVNSQVPPGGLPLLTDWSGYAGWMKSLLTWVQTEK